MAAPSVLGKRARASEPAEPSSITSRIKRRARVSSANDENEDPHSIRDVQYGAQQDHCMELVLDDPFHNGKRSSNGASIPAKHTITKGRIALSPTKISGHFKSTKAVLRESAKPAQLATPQTPRHRDALSKKVPVTPRHRVIVPGKQLTPRTPRTPFTPSSVPTIYNSARQLFVRSANPGRLVGREEERAQLNDFIQAGITSKSGRCMYVSGPPGTGKSALVSEVCGELQDNKNVRTSYINCMSVKGSKDIYSKLIEDLVDVNEEMNSDEVVVLKAMFLPEKGASSQVYVVTLDEIDHLLTLDLEILYTLFEWSLNRSSHLILVGIANALDLTDRFLPRLKARNLKPHLLPFLPYTVPQIVSVITTKLKSLLPADTNASPAYIPFFHPASIQFCSKKVASQTGDLRKAFDIIRRTIDLVEAETKQKHQEKINSETLQLSPSKTPLVENVNLSSPSQLSPPRSSKYQTSSLTLTASLSHLTLETAPKASIAHIARITSSAFGNGTAQRLQSLNLQQKAALCALIAFEKRSKNKSNMTNDNDIFSTPSKAETTSSTTSAPTVRKLYETYCGLCKRENALHALTATEFADVVGSLETLSLVVVAAAGGVDGKKAGGFRLGMGMGLGRLTPSKKGGRLEERRVVSCVGEKEVQGCLEEVGGGILRGMLRGGED